MTLERGPSQAPAHRPRLLVGLHTLRVAGAERIALELARQLGPDFRVSVASVFEGHLRPSILPPTTLVGGAWMLLFGRADVVHTHLFLPGLLARVRRIWNRRAAWIHTVHYHNYDAIPLGGLKRWLDHRVVFPATDVLVAVSDAVAETLAAHPQTVTVLNAIPLDPCEVLERPEGAAPVVGTVAMFRPEKNLDGLIRAVPHLVAAVPGARVRIAGDGPERPRLEELIRSLGVDDAVELCGYVEDMETFYRSLDVYVQPSHHEGFGLAAVEAFRFRLPLVVTSGGYLPEVAGRGTFGLVLPPSQSRPEELAAALARVWSEADEWRDRSRLGLAHWAERLSSDRMVAAYREILTSRAGPATPLHITVIQPVVTHATGGLQRQLGIQTRELVRRGFRVTLVQRRDPRLLQDPEKHAAWGHVELIQLPDAPWLPERLRGALFAVTAFLRLLFRRRRTHVYHAHQLHSPTLAGAGVKAVRGGALVAKVTAAGVLGEARQIRSLPLRGLRLRAFRLVDRVIVLHDAMGEEMAELGFTPDRIVRIPNAVELPPEPAPLTTSAGGTASILRLLWVGRLSNEKGLDLLLEAARILDARGRTLAVELVGGADPDRNAEPALRVQAATLPAGVSVRFHGVSDDVAAFYRAGPVFVLPSRSEGMSNALLEAMAWGLPCVASDIGANRALIEDGVTGLLFRDGDAASLAEALERLHDDVTRGNGALARALGRGARERIGAGFSPEAVGAALSALYQEIAG